MKMRKSENTGMCNYRAPNEINPLGFFCTPCQCNGHAEICHPSTGECVILEPNGNPAGKCGEIERPAGIVLGYLSYKNLSRQDNKKHFFVATKTKKMTIPQK